MWNDFYHMLNNKQLLRIIEVESKQQLSRRLIVLRRRYGVNNKIGFMLISAHGSEKQMALGPTNEDMISMADLGSKSTTRLKQLYYKANLPFGFISCSTGADDGIAHNFSRTFESVSTAPDKPTYPSEVIPIFDDENNVTHFDITYGNSATANQFDSGIKLKRI
jgi:hypothetical protein